MDKTWFKQILSGRLSHNLYQINIRYNVFIKGFGKRHFAKLPRMEWLSIKVELWVNLHATPDFMFSLTK